MRYGFRDVASHVISVKRFVKCGNPAYCFIEKCHGRRKQVAEDARHRHHHINARAFQFFQRDHFDFSDPIERITNRANPEQPERLSNSFPLRLDVVQPPENQSQGSRIARMFIEVTTKQSVRSKFRAGERHL
jgi:hypothetical protein